MEPEIINRGMFLVGVDINKGDEIILTIEKEKGDVILDDCVALSRFFESQFDRDSEDYSLTVTSAGLDKPFKVLKQYIKAIGSKVEVQIKGGAKIIATLKDANEEGITLEYSSLEKVEGKKKKQTVEHCDTFSMEQINSVTYFIEF